MPAIPVIQAIKPFWEYPLTGAIIFNLIIAHIYRNVMRLKQKHRALKEYFQHFTIPDGRRQDVITRNFQDRGDPLGIGAEPSLSQYIAISRRCSRTRPKTKPALPPAHSDPAELSQAFLNLLLKPSEANRDSISKPFFIARPMGKEAGRLLVLAPPIFMEKIRINRTAPAESVMDPLFLSQSPCQRR